MGQTPRSRPSDINVTFRINLKWAENAMRAEAVILGVQGTERAVRFGVPFTLLRKEAKI